MKFSTLVAIAIGFGALIMVLMASRSCAKSVAETRKNENRNNLVTTHPVTDQAFTDNYTDYYSEELSSEESTEIEYETVTNMLGEVVETIPVTSPEEANMPTTTLSILEEYAKSKGETPSSEVQTTTYEYVEPKYDVTLVID
ncbi:hypothetical protein [Ruminococcus flavefaciens]|uniref:Uncharacterized protein n=1 Tax=Ruminococcus flavefaciens 007c TaxID=1341157 RepID=W7UKK6_RUMFL|nr:hypothetical protein [Ruminococcus flavefaciens]EWM54323.1 hypothetical protein RF007C_11990 [Ruminococcus flavefaciens 007c]